MRPQKLSLEAQVVALDASTPHNGPEFYITMLEPVFPSRISFHHSAIFFFLYIFYKMCEFEVLKCKTYRNITINKIILCCPPSDVYFVALILHFHRT